MIRMSWYSLLRLLNNEVRKEDMMMVGRVIEMEARGRWRDKTPPKHFHFNCSCWKRNTSCVKPVEQDSTGDMKVPIGVEGKQLVRTRHGGGRFCLPMTCFGGAVSKPLQLGGWLSPAADLFNHFWNFLLHARHFDT